MQVKSVTSTEVFKLRAEGKVSSDKAAVTVKHTGTVKEERVLWAENSDQEELHMVWIFKFL